MRRFFILFIVLMLVLFYVDLRKEVQENYIVPFTGQLARVSGHIAALIDSDTVSYNRDIVNSQTGVGVRIDNGCNGIEACIVLISAMLAFPALWWKKLIGIAIGLLAVQAVNIIRIVCLFFLAQLEKDVFEFFHVYLWPSLIMLDVLVVFLLWMRFVNKDAPAGKPEPEPDVAAHGI